MDYKTEAKPKAMAGSVPVFCAHDEIVETIKLIPNPKNPNVHPESQIELLGKIIKSAGWRQPITVSKRSGFVVKGHGRLLAAQALGLEFVPVDWQEYSNEAEEYADLVADNRLAELSHIDQMALRDIFNDIDLSQIPAELTGYTEDEFKDIADIFANVDPEDAEEGPEDFDEVMPDTLAHKCPRCGFEFDD